MGASQGNLGVQEVRDVNEMFGKVQDWDSYVRREGGNGLAAPSALT